MRCRDSEAVSQVAGVERLATAHEIRADGRIQRRGMLTEGVLVAWLEADRETLEWVHPDFRD